MQGDRCFVNLAGPFKQEDDERRVQDRMPDDFRLAEDKCRREKNQRHDKCHWPLEQADHHEISKGDLDKSGGRQKEPDIEPERQLRILLKDVKPPLRIEKFFNSQPGERKAERHIESDQPGPFDLRVRKRIDHQIISHSEKDRVVEHVEPTVHDDAVYIEKKNAQTGDRDSFTEQKQDRQKELGPTQQFAAGFQFGNEQGP